MEKSNINNKEIQDMEKLKNEESLERDMHLLVCIYILRKMKDCCPACKIQGMCIKNRHLYSLTK